MSIVPFLMARAALSSPTFGPSADPTDLTAPLLNTMLTATGGAFEVYHVTNENTSGAGSFLDAVTNGSTATTRIVVFDIAGGVRLPTYPEAGGPDIERERFFVRGNLFVAGETAPGAGFNVHGYPFIDGSNIVFRHIRFIPSAPAGAMNHANNYEVPRGISVAPNNTTHENIVFQNCEVNHGIDTSIYLNPKNGGVARNFALVNCIVAEALSDAEQQTRDELSYGHQYTWMSYDNCFRQLAYGNLISCMSYRSPLIGGNCEIFWTNNLHYNHGQPGTQSRWSALGAIDLTKINAGQRVILDWSNNAFRGGAQSSPQNLAGQYISYMGETLHADGDVRFFLDGNRFYTACSNTPTSDDDWDSVNDQLFGSLQYDQIVTAQPSIVGFAGDYTAGTFEGSSPWGAAGGLTLPTTIKAASAVEGYVLAYAGAIPANRDANSQRIVDGVVNETARVNVGPTPTFADPALQTVAADLPDGLGTTHLASGDGTHAAVSGYDAGQITSLEAWLHDRHLAALGIPSGAGDYDPNVAGNWIATSGDPVLA